MGTNLSLADIKKISNHMINAYALRVNGYRLEADLPENQFNVALARVLEELHLTTLSNDLLHEIKNVRGD